MADGGIAESMRYLEVTQEQKLKDQAKVFDPKKFCWVPTAKDNLDGYVVAEIKSANGDMVTVEVKGSVSCF